MSGPGWTKVEDRAHLELEGPDAVRFLNGQVSNDISGDLDKRVVPACLCSLKGKVEFLVWVTRGFSEDSLLIETESEQSAAIFDRLDRYLIADDCQWNSASESIDLFHILSDKPPTKIRRNAGDMV